MIDHLEISTRQLDAALRFYADVLAPLGYSLQVDGPAKGFGDGRTLDFFLREGEPGAEVHYAFASPDRATVDRIYAIGGAAGHLRSRRTSIRTIMRAICAIPMGG